MHAAALAEPAQNEHGLAEWPQRAGALRVTIWRRSAASSRDVHSTTWRGTSNLAAQVTSAKPLFNALASQ
jgi:hypothetical protein